MSKQKKSQGRNPAETVTDEPGVVSFEAAPVEIPVGVVDESVPPAGEPISAVSVQTIEADGGNKTQDLPNTEAQTHPFANVPIIGLREQLKDYPIPATPSPEIKISADTVTVDKKAFAKLIYALVIGQPSNYLRYAAIPRLGDLFHVKEYNEQVKLWNELKEYHNAG